MSLPPLFVLATAIAIGFTAPERATSYFLMRSWDYGVTWESRPVWKDSALTIPLTPSPAGTAEHGFVWTNAPDRNDFVACVVASNAVGSAASNRLVISTGLKDTTQFLVRGPGIYTEPRMPKNGIAAWPLVVGDSASFSVIDQGWVQTSLCGWLMAHFRDASGPYYCLAGLRRRVCP